MKYRCGECSPELGDHVEVHDEQFEPELARVTKIGKSRIKVTYDNDCIKPRSEWVNNTDCDMISREG